ncbi:hypothetical protein G7085_18610 [Tessaracoccus sp. HDW20]|uniref:hypothetical protein n=1 Tax=Tessaracoccus coleopterorum TaxID=2714950 RepID=UPI0018D3D0C2|nr:hypothetical protein [Tessaracoccus coleopterorum]NHB85884.1 hypothetical protein [Tessaracoccus coleopterorum]
MQAIAHALESGDDDLALEIIRDQWIRIVTETGARALNAQCLTLPSRWPGTPTSCSSVRPVCTCSTTTSVRACCGARHTRPG